MKALGLVVSDKKIFENCILKTYFLTLWPTYATKQNHLNKFGRGPPRDHSCEVWSKFNEWFQRRRCLCKKVYARLTTDDARRTTTDNEQRPVTIAHHEHFVLRWAKIANDSIFDYLFDVVHTYTLSNMFVFQEKKEFCLQQKRNKNADQTTQNGRWLSVKRLFYSWAYFLKYRLSRIRRQVRWKMCKGCGGGGFYS